VTLLNLASGKMGYTPLFLLQIGLGSQFPWITCMFLLQPSMRMTVSSRFLVESLSWKIWHPGRRESYLRPLLISSLNVFGFFFGSHGPLFCIEIVGY